MAEPLDHPHSPALRFAWAMGPVARRRTPRLPPVTLALAVVNILAACAQFALGGFHWRGADLGNSGIDWLLGAKIPSLVAHGEYWRLVTASFLHGSWWPHLFFNMLCLAGLGTMIELSYGSARTFVIYLFACVTGTIASFFFTPVTSLGASTGIMGLLGALLVHNFRYRRHLPERLNAVYPYLIGLLFLELGLDFFNKGVDVMGHVGGVAGGAVAASLLAGRCEAGVQVSKDRVPFRLALGLVIALAAYGVYGLATTIPSEPDLRRIARADSNSARIEPLLRVVQQRPYFAEARDQAILLLLDQRRVRDATGLLEEALALDPAHRARLLKSPVAEAVVQGNYRRSRLASARARWEEALASDERVLSLATNPALLAEMHNDAAWILVDDLGRNLDTAESHVREALRISPDNSAYLDTLAWVYYKQGRLGEAASVQEGALRQLKAEPNNAAFTMAELYYHLGAIYEKLGRRDEAVRAYMSALRGQPDYPRVSQALRRLFPGGRPAPPGLLPAFDPAVQRGVL